MILILGAVGMWFWLANQRELENLGRIDSSIEVDHHLALNLTPQSIQSSQQQKHLY